MQYLYKDPKPWQHQDAAFDFAYDLESVGLFMDMGTGKTKVAINLMVNWGCYLSLILCPKSVVPVWPNEFKEHCPIPFQVVALTGTTKQNVELLKNLDYSLPTAIVTNYESVCPVKRKVKDVNGREIYISKSELGDLILGVAKNGDIDAIFCDESHKIKSATSKISKYCHKLSGYVPKRVAMTGTPLGDKWTDAFGQYRFLDDTIFGTSYADFKKEYASVNPLNPNQITGFENEDEFNRRFYSLAFIVKAEEVQDLPPTQHITRYCWLSALGKKMYKELEENFIAFLEEHSEEVENHLETGKDCMVVSNVLSKMLRLHQLSSGLATLEKEVAPTVTEQYTKEVDTSKRELLKELLQELGNDEPVVIFYRFKHDLENIKKVCLQLGRKCAEQNGNIHQWEAFQDAGKDNISGTIPNYDTIAVNIRSGGAGINLTRARHHIYYTVGLSLADYDQSLKRGHRPDKRYKHKRILYHHLVVKGTMDEEIRGILKDKKKPINAILKGYMEKCKRKK